MWQRGWVQVLALSCFLGIRMGKRLQSLWGEFVTTAGFCLLLPSYREWSFAPKSGHCTGTLLTPYLTKQGTLHHLLGCSGQKPGSRAPSPPKELLLVLLGSHAAAAPPHFFGYCSDVYLLHCNSHPVTCRDAATAAEFLIHLIYHPRTLLIRAFPACYSAVPAAARFAIRRGTGPAAPGLVKEAPFPSLPPAEPPSPCGDRRPSSATAPPAGAGQSPHPLPGREPAAPLAAVPGTAPRGKCPRGARPALGSALLGAALCVPCHPYTHQ